MGKIQVLAQNVANQIAAGEVVERPCSVVKELIENAIDAGATMISVDILNGGIDYIRVSDNGHGIANNECRTAFLPHATSKIEKIEDIHHIYTLGFRGEALPSIASIADVILRSRTENDSSGNELHIAYGEFITEKPCACTEGTSIEVRNMFSKTPARLKFLKSERTEAGYIGDYIARMIMAYPEISFSYSNNGKKTYHSFGDNSLKNAIFSVYGSDTLQYLKEVSFDNGYLGFNGYIGTAELSRPNRQYQSFYVNRRYIRSTLLSSALQAAYDTKLMSGRYPFAVVNMKIASSEVDINVHPTKMEVRFSDEQRVYNNALEAFDNALAESIMKSEKSILSNNFEDKIHQTEYINREQKNSNAEYKMVRFPQTFSGMEKEQKTGTNINYFHIYSNKEKAPVQNIQEKFEFSEAEYKIVGSVFAGYWIIEQNDCVFIIDQHAAHERRLYERIMKREVEVASQKLLSPIHIKLTEPDLAVLLQTKDELNAFGFELESTEDGANVLSVPVINTYTLKPTDLIEVLDLVNTNKGISPKEYIKEALIQSSCKHAIKITEQITEAEIKQLLSEYQDKNVPMTCPHGRPVMIRVKKSEIEKMFKRIL